MLKLRIRPQWVLEQRSGVLEPLPRLLDLCAALHEQGNLARACKAVGISYRHAWGAIRRASELFGAPLVELKRGSGAQLTPLGEKMLWADKRIAARLSPLLDSIASELEAALERTLSKNSPLVRMYASHGFAVAALRDLTVEQQFPLELKYVASQEALASLSRGDCELAGFSVPVGEFEHAALRAYGDLLTSVPLTFIHVATRTQGLMLPSGNPKQIHSLRDLVKPGVRFINRQPGSATRLLLDLMLEQQKIDGRRVAGYEMTEYTHAAVAAFIASGMADAGFGIETAARQFKLDFIPAATERYLLACRSDGLSTKPIRTLIDTIGSAPYKARVNALAGYDGRDAGATQTFARAFRSLATKSNNKTTHTTNSMSTRVINKAKNR